MNKWLLPIILLLNLLSCKSEKSEFKAIDLLCEYLENPVGLDVSNPRLFWKMDKPERGAMQTAYQIQAATSSFLLNNDNSDLWDTGIIHSDQSIQIDYKGKPLQSQMEVFWRVRIWDENEEVSPWSKTAHWEMALMKSDDWQAKWIGAPAKMTSNELKYASPFFRKEINLTGENQKSTCLYFGTGIL